MKVTLTESAGGRGGRPGVTLFSAALHFAGIALAIVATGWSAAPSTKEPVSEPLVFVAARPSPLVPMQPTEPRTVPSSRAASTTSVVPTGTPIDLPVDIPTGIPPIPLAGTTWDPSRELTRPLGTLRGGPGAATSGTPGVGEIFSSGIVERQVVPLPGAEPRYPQMLQQAGIEGEVTMRFVVDTLGRVEPGSAQMIAASHALFERAVRDALPRMRFVAAEAGGRKVRQLVEQPFSFAIRR